jgi:uncharacterized membrane protein
MTANRSTKPSSEELIIYALLVAIGVIPGLIALVQRTAFGVEATLGLLMACAGVAGAIVYTWRTRCHRTG